MEGNERIRVLIADDSFFIRTYLVELLRLDPDIEVVGTAATGDDVVVLARTLKPDVITMDYNMPGKNGIEATAAIMHGERPLPAILMLSAFSGKEGEAVRRTLEASGAYVVVKPSGEVSLDIEKVAGEITRKIKEVGQMGLGMRKSYERFHHPVVHPARSHRSEQELSCVIVIGASTGGPPLVEHLLTQFDPSDGIAIIVIQHMSKYFTEIFAERLDRVTPFHVREAVDGDVPTPGVALVIPGGYTLQFSKGIPPTFSLSLAPSNRREKEIDDAMTAIAHHYGPLVGGVLLSGMGSDGTEGLRAIKEHGGLALVQDPHTATVGAMPEHAVQGGGAEAALPLQEIPGRFRIHFHLRKTKMEPNDDTIIVHDHTDE